jgi:hypothetical protein
MKLMSAPTRETALSLELKLKLERAREDHPEIPDDVTEARTVILGIIGDLEEHIRAAQTDLGRLHLLQALMRN